MVLENYGLPFKKPLAVCWRKVADDRRSPLSIVIFLRTWETIYTLLLPKFINFLPYMHI